MHGISFCRYADDLSLGPAGIFQRWNADSVSPCSRQNPDKQRKKEARTAIEVTDHYNDTVAGRLSPRTPVGNFWQLVEASLVRRISHRKPLTGILGSVRFNRKVAWPTGKGKAI